MHLLMLYGGVKVEKITLSNGSKLLYERLPGGITSFTIALEAGANVEEENQRGLAHVVEHMVFKGTNSYSESEINNLCNELFGFHNAMTNYPYVVYYGSSLVEDFLKAFKLYYDIVFNPSLKEEGFKEEIAVIIEELKEWKDDVVQHCEDMLFWNSFSSRRLKELIIGNEEAIKNFTLKDVKKFHKQFYRPQNAVISVATSMDLKEVINLIESSINLNNPEENNNTDPGMKEGALYEEPKEGIFIEENPSVNGCKVQYIFPIDSLTERECTLLYLFNEYFASGTSSVLYEEIRTKRGLVYDVQGKIKGEKGIKLYTITLSTAKENLETVRRVIKECINKVKEEKNIFNNSFIEKYLKNQKTKRMLSLEKSIVLSMHLAVYELMYGKGELLLNQFDKILDFKEEEMVNLIKKVFANETIGIIVNKN